MKAQEKKGGKQSVNKQMGIGSLGMQWNKQLLFLQTCVLQRVNGNFKHSPW